MSETNPPTNFTVAGSIGKGSFAPNAISASAFAKCTCLPSEVVAGWRITHVNGAPVCCGDPSSTTTVAYTPPEFLRAGEKYHRDRLAELAENPWHAEVRERYRLEPRSCWKQPLFCYAVTFAAQAGWNIWHHHPLNLLAGAIGSVIGFAGLTSVYWLWNRTHPVTRTSL